MTIQRLDMAVRIGFLTLIVGLCIGIPASAWHRAPDGGDLDAFGAARKPLVIIAGQTQAIPTADFVSSPGGFSSTATTAQAGDVETAEINESTDPLAIGGRTLITPPALTATHPYGLHVDVAGSGANTQTQQAIRGEIEDGYSGAGDPIAVTGVNHSASGDPVVGVTGLADGAGSNNFGGLFRAQNAAHNVGLCAALNINCHRISNVGVPFDAALLLDNGVTGKPIIIATSNGNDVMELLDTGTLDFGAGLGTFITKDGQLGTQAATDTDAPTLKINHVGYLYGTTRYRGVQIQDGKGVDILTTTGSTRAVKAFASLEVERMINAGTVPTVVCDSGTPTPTGGEWKGHVAPAVDATTCALTFGHAVTSCTCSLKLDHVEVATGIGRTCSFVGGVLTVAAAPTWALGDFDYDCSVGS